MFTMAMRLPCTRKIDLTNSIALFLAWSLLFGGVFTDALQYDYTAISECLADPLKPQYNGGIVRNSEINDGLNGWTNHGNVEIEPRASTNGNYFLVAHSRKQSHASASQKFFLEKDKHYTFSAWIQVSDKKNVPVKAMFKTAKGLKPAGVVDAHAGCWSMLKGGLSVASSGPAELFFMSNETSIDLWIDNISLQPFTKEEWKSHQDQSIEKARKANVRLQVLDSEGRPVRNTNISLVQNKVGFPFGSAINQNILNNPAYQSWFTSRSFTVTTFENEMKWYSTEQVQGKEDYSVADNMLQFASKNGISVRGHNIFWEDPHYQVQWVNNLSPADLKAAADKRLNSIVPRYAGKVIAWDVDNENLHFNFFPSKLGGNISQYFYQRTSQLDGRTTLFLNDFNTLEQKGDASSSPSKYLQKLADVTKALGGNNKQLAIGLEGHFDNPDLAYMRSATDTLASAGVPLWITELDVGSGYNQAANLEQILREVHAHPAIKGIIIWSAWAPQGCYRMCLTDNNFKNLPTGDVVDKLLKEWSHYQPVVGTTDGDGYFNASLFHGEYELKLIQQSSTMDNQDESSSFVSQRLKVEEQVSEQLIRITV